ncbi:MAG: prolipoprotein diacylglyceryl transferase [Planctomycetota bacterium]|jgi:phosphatidylglycerol:prolipoprotein diacylglycerol transferase
MGEIKFPCWDPVLLDLPGPFDLRWYGLMYVVAFLVGHHILTRLARSQFFPLPKERVGDLIFLLIFGVILGGRMGYVLFYPKRDFLEHPLDIFKIWEGGLSFHGGLIGVVITFIWFAHRHKISALRLSDCCALATAPGIFFVRMANFVNSELWGRETDASVPWAMRFPRDPEAETLLQLHELPRGDIRSVELAIQYAFDRTQAAWQRLLNHVGPAYRDRVTSIQEDLNWDKIMPGVPLRHPSQIYEGLAEGALLGLVLWFLIKKAGGKLRTGTYSVIFLLGYGVARFFLESYREPDRHMGFMLFGWMTMGQILCAAMAVAALLVLWFRRGRGRGQGAGPPPRQPQAPAQPQEQEQGQEQEPAQQQGQPQDQEQEEGPGS